MSAAPEAEGAAIEDRLRAGQVALRRIRLRVSGTVLGFFAFCALVFVPVYFLEDIRCRTDFVHLLRGGIVWTVTDASFVLCLLAPLPDDKALTMLAIGAGLVWTLPGLLSLWRDDCADLEPLRRICGDSLIVEREWCVVHLATETVAEACVVIGFSVALILGLRGMHASRMQRIMLRAASLMYGIAGTYALFEFAMSFALAKAVSVATVSTMLCLAVLPATRSHRLRDCIHVRLERLYSAHRELHAAAGVAGLVGDCSAQEALAQAAQRFRGVHMERLDFQALLDNAAGAQLNGLAEPVRLGGCDAFLSHSWHDPPRAKWEALQRWRSGFAQESGRDPCVWLDKYCIDQNRIELDLRSLPIFLSGCKELVILIGPTYLRRLWCVVELFTFVHMGGDIGRIVVLPVLREGQEEEDRRQIQREFAAFGAEQCDCAKPEDKERMLSIIRSAFGSVGEFNACVRQILDETNVFSKRRASFLPEPMGG